MSRTRPALRLPRAWAYAAAPETRPTADGAREDVLARRGGRLVLHRHGRRVGGKGRRWQAGRLLLADAADPAGVALGGGRVTRAALAAVLPEIQAFLGAPALEAWMLGRGKTLVLPAGSGATAPAPERNEP